MIETLKLENIQLGDLMETANKALELIGMDVMQRNDLNKPRKVIIEISITPQTEDLLEGKQNVPEVDWTVKHAVPGHAGMTTRAFVRDGKLIVNKGAPTEANPNQATVFDVVAN